MAIIKSMEMEDTKVRVIFEMSKDELVALSNETQNICLLSLTKFNELLTTGTIGNSNRIMFPNRLLKRYNIKELPKHVETTILSFNGKRIAVLKLQDTAAPVPRFEGE